MSDINNVAAPPQGISPRWNTTGQKMAARELNEKKILLPTEKEAEQITGLQAGGISPLALINKGFQVIVDEAAKEYESIHVSGGQRGLNIKIPVASLLELAYARVGKISIPDE